MENNNWESWSNFVLKELERSNSNYEKLTHEIAEINKSIVENNLKNSVELSKLDIKAGVWGGLSGAITLLIIVLLGYLKK